MASKGDLETTLEDVGSTLIHVRVSYVDMDIVEHKLHIPIQIPVQA